MRRPRASFIIAVWMGLTMRSVAAPPPSLDSLGHLPAPAADARQVEHDGVAVRVDVIDAQQTEDIFGANLLRKGIQPLLVTIRNASQQIYEFRKARVAMPSIPATAAATKAYENPLSIGPRIVGQTTRTISGILFPFHHQVSSRPVSNRVVRDSFTKEEIQDADVHPNASIAGFLFVKPLEPGQQIQVILINANTQQPLIFEIPTIPSATR